MLIFMILYIISDVFGPGHMAVAKNPDPIIIEKTVFDYNHVRNDYKLNFI